MEQREWDRNREIEEIKARSAFIISEPLFKSSGANIGPDGIYKPNVLCPACQQTISAISTILSSANKNGKSLSETISLDHFLSEVHLSADLGCHMCAIIEASTKNTMREGQPSTFDQLDFKDCWLSVVLLPSNDASALCGLHCEWVTLLGTSRGGAWINLYGVQTLTQSSFAAQIPPSSLGSDTGDETTFDLAKYWLSICQNTHEKCKSVHKPTLGIPRRLIHLQEIFVQVVENDQNFEYVCLSHCWGSQEHVPTRLIEGNNTELFEIESLPKTFRDAIEVVKRLGYSYLWIDCFCIVQGSKQDWLEQSAVMAQIYANSAFTVASLASRDVTGGCFHTRNPLALRPLHTPEYRLEIRDKSRLWDLEVTGFGFRASPLHTRAWVVQERLSARRTLFYGALGVYWECQSMKASESHLQLIDDNASNIKTMLSRLQEVASDLTKIPNTSSQAVFQERWQRLLYIYTSCVLTYDTDKLIALSGITTDIQKSSSREYVLGLWKEDLTGGLLWFHPHDHNPVGKVEVAGHVENGLPSWSWASMQGTIMYPSAGGSIDWQALVTVQDDNSVLELNSWIREVSLDEYDDIKLVDDGSGRGDLSEGYAWFHDEETQENQMMHVVLLQRVTISKSPYIAANKCLVLIHVKDNIYKRIGVCNIRFSVKRDDPFPHGLPLNGDVLFLI